MDWDKVFNVHTEFINDNLQISVFEVKELNIDTQRCLDDNLIAICEGEYSFSDIAIVKKRIRNLFDDKNE